jgi:hypothetical protein
MPEYLHESLIDQISDEMYTQNLTLGTRKATDWMISKLRSIPVKRRELMRDNERLTPESFLGGMFFYYYDPKHKKTLPYYDTFPLVIPVGVYKDGFLALNLHYLSPRQRVAFLRELSGYTNNQKYDETTRFKLTYNLLTKVSKLKEFEPCLKRYLAKHIRSQFLRIDGHEWHIAILLPVEAFQKKSSRQVWRSSRETING